MMRESVSPGDAEPTRIRTDRLSPPDKLPEVRPGVGQTHHTYASLGRDLPRVQCPVAGDARLLHPRAGDRSNDVDSAILLHGVGHRQAMKAHGRRVRKRAVGRQLVDQGAAAGEHVLTLLRLLRPEFVSVHGASVACFDRAEPDAAAPVWRRQVVRSGLWTVGPLE